jgi:hypothetical protein
MVEQQRPVVKETMAAVLTFMTEVVEVVALVLWAEMRL